MRSQSQSQLNGGEYSPPSLYQEFTIIVHTNCVPSFAFTVDAASESEALESPPSTWTIRRAIFGATANKALRILNSRPSRRNYWTIERSDQLNTAWPVN